MKKNIGIIGGMGPMATADLFKKIIENTNASSDQEHIRVFIDNNTNIPDRTSAILNGAQSPIKELVSSADKLISIGADILVMPCNTAHYFYDDVVNELDSDVEFIHMIKETASHIVSKFGKGQKVYLLATTGTYGSKIYNKIFEDFDIELVLPKEDIQNKVMKMIYDYKNGKLDIRKDDLLSIKEDALSIGASKMILGCTELPLIFEKYGCLEDTIDPTHVLALCAIEKALK